VQSEPQPWSAGEMSSERPVATFLRDINQPRNIQRLASPASFSPKDFLPVREVFSKGCDRSSMSDSG
jgi:hypothetical protein